MTKKKLEQLRYLNREILKDREELARLKCGRYDDKHIYGKLTERELKEREMNLNKKIERSKQLRREILDFIDGIEDSLTRQVIFYRYIKCLTWGGVACMTGGYNSEENVRKIANRYLERGA